MSGRPKKFIIFHTSTAGPPREWDLEAVWICSEHRRAPLLEEHDEIGEKYTSNGIDKERKIPTIRLLGRYSACAKFREISGLSSCGDAYLRVMNIASPRYADDYGRRKRHAGKIPVGVLERRGSYRG